MNLIPAETLRLHLQRADMAECVTLPIEFFRDLIYQAMPLEDSAMVDREATAVLVEQMGIEGFGTLAIAAAIRTGSKP